MRTEGDSKRAATEERLKRRNEAKAKVGSAHSAAAEVPREQRRLEDRARGFQPRAAMERLISMAESDPRRQRILQDPTRRLELGHYVLAREAAIELKLFDPEGAGS